MTTEIEFINYLMDSGLDPKHIDHEGNNSCHVAAPVLAKSRGGSHLFLQEEEGFALGIDPNLPNESGRTPLHDLSSFRSFAFDPGSLRENRSANADIPTVFDDLTLDIDCADQDAITPLHLACTFSEYQTRRLLETGANSSDATTEGLTPLHLAARSRQANVLGVLLEWLPKKDEKKQLAMLNVKDILRRTPLFYACASGRIESVQLLLDAGATMAAESSQGYHGMAVLNSKRSRLLLTGHEELHVAILITSTHRKLEGS